MDKYKYDVALSFAGEQRDYVKKLAKYLSDLGITTFYDEDHKIQLWGQNVIEYLEKVYYKDSRYCVIFISKEYKEKCWTVLEREIIEERMLLQDDSNHFQKCILPVRFDDTKLPGIRNNLGVIYATKISPEELAQMIYKKIQYSKLPLTETFKQASLDDIFDELAKILPSNFIENHLKKSTFNQKTDALLLFNNDNKLINNFVCYDGKVFIDDDGKLYFLNIGYFNESEILFETTAAQLINLITKKIL